MGKHFAAPIAHQTTQNYAAFANAVVLGRPYRQPLKTGSNPLDFSPGCEIFLSSAGDVPGVFSWLDGKLKREIYIPAGTVSTAAATAIVTGTGTGWTSKLEGRRIQFGTSPDSYMILSVDSPTQLTLDRNHTASAGGQTYTVTPSRLLTLETELTGGVGKIRHIEGLPVTAYYENIDETSIQTSLEAVLNNAYTHARATANSGLWHRSMQMRLTAGNIRLKTHLDRATSATAEVTAIVARFLAGTGAGFGAGGIDVAAGDALGQAAAYLSSDLLPVSPPFALGTLADPNRARRLTFSVVDTCGQIIDPVYYFHLFMRQMLTVTRSVESRTNVVSGGAISHPLADLFPALTAAASPRPRAQDGGLTRFPLGRLANFHRHPDPNPTSQNEWHYSDDSVFEARLRGSTALINLSPSAAQRNQVSALWTAEGPNIASACDILQIPCELFFFFAGTESHNFDARYTRFEPLIDANRTQMRGRGITPALELEYDHLTGVRGTVTTVTHNNNVTSAIEVNLNNARTFQNNLLTRIRASMLVEDVDRLRIRRQSATLTPTRVHTLTVDDTPMQGGFPAASSQNSGTTLFYSPVQRLAGAAGAPAASAAASRAGILRRLEVSSSTNNLDGPTSITLMVGGVASALTVTLAAGALNGSNLIATVPIASGARLSIQVVTAGSSGAITNLTVRLRSAPAVNADIWVTDGGSATVPNPWDGAALIKAATSTLTWDQLVTIIDATDGARVSPGLTQNLISSAILAIKRLNLAPHIVAAGLPPVPATPGGFMNDWLLHAAHSVFAAGAEIRDNYKSNKTFFDLPLSASAYNTGGVTTRKNSPWGLTVSNDYIPRGAPYFNAAADLFNTVPPPATAPTVRFAR